MSKVRNITVLESLFFGRGEPTCYVLQRRGRKVSTELPLTKGGIVLSKIPRAKEPFFRVGLEAELTAPNVVLSDKSYATTVNIQTAHNNGTAMADPLLDLPDQFIDVLGNVNDQIEASGSITPVTVADLLSLARPASLSVEGLKCFRGWADIADALNLDAEELVALLNSREISLQELARELGLRVEKIK